MTIQNAPPGLDYDRDKRFSKVLMLLPGALRSLHFSGLEIVITCSWFVSIGFNSLSKKWLLCAW